MGGSPTVYGVGLLIGALLSCRGSQPDAGGDDVARIGSDSTGAPVIREASVVAFWLAASDTLGRGEGADLLDDFRAYTQLVSPFLADRGIPLLTTNAESLIVELSGGPRRVIVLAGLDYPFGYVLVEPGYPESILTGVSTEDELLSEVDWYFGLDEEGETPDGRRQVVRLGHGGALPARRAPSALDQRGGRRHPLQESGVWLHPVLAEGSSHCPGSTPQPCGRPQTRHLPRAVAPGGGASGRRPA